MLRLLSCLKKIVQIAFSIVLLLLLVSNLYLIIMQYLINDKEPTIFGYSTAVVISGSMEPALAVNDMILNHAQDSYAVGDIITFQSNGSLVTHRIVASAENGFVTKGDANNASDIEPVLSENIVGKVIFKIPYAGSIIAFLKTPLGMTILVFIGFLLIELPILLRKGRNKTDKEGAK